jgi:hypothetical protein
MARRFAPLMVVAVFAGAIVALGEGRREEAPAARSLARVVRVAEVEGLGRAAVVAADGAVFVALGTFSSDELRVWRYGADGRRTELAGVRQARPLAPNTSMTAWRDAPCVATATKAAADVACLDGGQWVSQGLPAQWAGWAIQQLFGDGDRLSVLLINPRVPRQAVLLRRTADAWETSVPVPPTAADAIHHLGRDLAARPAPLISSVGSRRRVVRALGADGRWQTIARRVLSGGLVNQNSGPLRTSRRILLSRSTIRTRRWPFTVDVAIPGGGLAADHALSTPGRASQGVLTAVGQDPWVLWQEATVRPGVAQDVNVVAAELDPLGRPQRRYAVATLRGVVQPSFLDVVTLAGRTYVLTTEAHAGARTRTTVSLRRVD